MSVKNLLENLSVEELRQLAEEANSGRIEQRILQKSKSVQQKICAVCGEEFAKNNGFILEFGTPDFRRKAHFCALDCMEYFIKHIKDKGGVYY